MRRLGLSRWANGFARDTLWSTLASLSLLLLLAVPAAGQDEEEEVDLGRTACADCHEEAEVYATTPHGRAMGRRDPAILERSCAGCHQPSPEHLEDPLPENVVRVPRPEGCASAGCHGEKSGQLHLATPAHVRHGVACLDCHDLMHGAEPGPVAAERWLLAEPSFELCGSCHREQASAASRPFAHREGAEPFACVNCHSVHGARRVGRLAFGGNGGACLDCHTAQAGPFIFPHPPRAVDGCLACHRPHGSTNPRLLTRRTVLSLCLECHTGVPAFHDLTQPRFRACVSCHFAVHGSNREPRLFDE